MAYQNNNAARISTDRLDRLISGFLAKIKERGFLIGLH
jgi:hypothetical protein